MLILEVSEWLKLIIKLCKIIFFEYFFSRVKLKGGSIY